MMIPIRVLLATILFFQFAYSTVEIKGLELGSGFPNYSIDENQNSAQSASTQPLTSVVLLNSLDESKLESENADLEPEDSPGTIQTFNQNPIIVNESKVDVLDSLQPTNQNGKEEAEIQTPIDDQNQLILSDEDSSACTSIETYKEDKIWVVESVTPPELKLTSSEQPNKTPQAELTHFNSREALPTYANTETDQSYQASPPQGSRISRLSQSSNPKFILLFRYPTIQPIVEDYSPYPIFNTPRYAYGPSYRSAPVHFGHYRSRQNPSFYRSNPWLSKSSPYAYNPRNYFSGAIPFNRNYQLNSNNPNPRFRRRLANEEEEKYSNQQSYQPLTLAFKKRTKVVKRFKRSPQFNQFYQQGSHMTNCDFSGCTTPFANQAQPQVPVAPTSYSPLFAGWPFNTNAPSPYLYNQPLQHFSQNNYNPWLGNNPFTSWPFPPHMS